MTGIARSAMLPWGGNNKTLKHNLKRNKHAIVPWNKAADQAKYLSPPYNVVLATDVVYIEETVGPLVSTMEALVKDDQLPAEVSGSTQTVLGNV
ncbi:hypothetical protein Pyn_10264 [Prunus yedoensis var. nudiflora]|uniref:Uncharacterized protein n=1 Tax=Prunus yedoensis var. nudiflora TaxID=2094558 RepID=A0A314UDZ5_PRUYE|nr:hypothetical protein Pyn_10264 [Prunus yedoensis var. nudiflora]